MKDLSFIPDITSYTVVKQLVDGCSGDDKYLIEKNSSYFLLRVGAKTGSDNSRKEYERLKKYVGKDINTHIPVCFGTTESSFYSIVSWVNGMPVMDIIKQDLTKNYCELGEAVGRELRKLHNASISEKQTDWNIELKNKATLFLDYYRKMDIEFPNSEKATEYINHNLNIVLKHEQVILHGDFHWNNVVADDNGRIGIIDFSGVNIGDPWYEFGGILWALEYSESFSNGQIDGYFNGQPPMDFWRIFKLYVALYAFEHLAYCNGTYEDRWQRISNASRMLSIFGEGFDLEIPNFRKY